MITNKIVCRIQQSILFLTFLLWKFVDTVLVTIVGTVFVTFVGIVFVKLFDTLSAAFIILSHATTELSVINLNTYQFHKHMC